MRIGGLFRNIELSKGETDSAYEGGTVGCSLAEGFGMDTNVGGSWANSFGCASGGMAGSQCTAHMSADTSATVEVLGVDYR